MSGGTPDVILLRQQYGTLSARICWPIVFVLAYTFAGFGVYWLLTGSTTVGVGGTVSSLGGLVWVGPLFVLGVPLIVAQVVGDRGPLRWYFESRTTIAIERSGLIWSSQRNTGRIDWADIGRASSVTAGFRCIQETVYDRSAAEVVTLYGPFVVDGTQSVIALPEAIVAMRPDVFEPQDSQHPQLGCVRRDRQMR